MPIPTVYPHTVGQQADDNGRPVRCMIGGSPGLWDTDWPALESAGGGGIAMDVITEGYRPPTIVVDSFSDSPMMNAEAGSSAIVELASTVYAAANQACAWFILILASDDTVLSGQEAALSLSNATPYRDKAWCAFWEPAVDNQQQRGAGVPLTSDQFTVPADGQFKVRYYAIGAARYDQNGDINIKATVWKDAVAGGSATADQYLGWQGNGHEYFAGDKFQAVDQNTGKLHVWEFDVDHVTVGEDFEGEDVTMLGEVGASYTVGSRGQYANGTGDAGIWSGGELSEGHRLKNISDKVPSAFDSNIAVGTYGSNGAIGMVGWAVDPIDNKPYVTIVDEVTVNTNPSETPLEWELLSAIDNPATDPMRVLLGEAAATQGGGVVTFNDTYANIKAKYFRIEAYMVSDGFDVPTSRHHLAGGSFLTAFIEDGLPMRVEGSGRISSFTPNNNGAGPMSVTNGSVSAGPQAIKFYGVKNQFRSIGVNAYQVDDTSAPATGVLAGFVDDGSGGTKLSPLTPIPASPQFEVFNGTDETPKLHSPKLLKDDIEFITARRHLLEHSDETKNLFGTNAAYQKYAFKNGKIFEAIAGVVDPNADPTSTSVGLQAVREANWRQASGVIYLNMSTIAVPSAALFTVVDDLPLMESGDTVFVTIKLGTISSTMFFTYKASGQNHKIHTNTHEWGIGIVDRDLSLDVVTGTGLQTIEAIKIVR